MSLVGSLLTAQRRSSPAESRRVSAAIDEALDPALRDPDNADGASAVAAAELAYRQVTVQIAAEKNPRTAPSATHLSAFGDKEETGVGGFEDAEPTDYPNLRVDPHFLIGGPVTDTTTEATTDPSPGAPPWAVPEQVGVAMTTSPELDDAPSAEGAQPVSGQEAADTFQDPVADNAAHAPVWDEPLGVPAPVVDTQPAGDTAGAHDPASGDSSNAESPKVPVNGDIPSPTDPPYGSGTSPWGDAIELDPTTKSPGGSVPTPPAVSNSPVPPPRIDPSPRATQPPDHFDLPEPDRQLSLPQRIRESVDAWLDQLRRGGRLRAKWIAAGLAAVLLIGAAGVFSLSGGRGKPPEPAGVTAAAPSQTESPLPAPTEMTLVPATSSASCGDDSDTVAPFTGEKSRAWVCRRPNGLDGAVFNMTFAKPVVITSITAVFGFNYVSPDGRDEWGRHRLITGVAWRLGGKVYPQTINPTRTGATMNFPAVLTQEMSMTITSSVRPPRSVENSDGIGGATDAGADVDETTAVSSITITGYPAGGATGGIK